MSFLMSRYLLKLADSEKRAKELYVGYDKPLGGYFFQVLNEEGSYIEPWEPVADRLSVLQIIDKYADPNNKLNIAVRQAVMFHKDPKELLGKEQDSWVNYPTPKPPK